VKSEEIYKIYTDELRTICSQKYEIACLPDRQAIERIIL